MSNAQFESSMVVFYFVLVMVWLVVLFVTVLATTVADYRKARHVKRIQEKHR